MSQSTRMYWVLSMLLIWAATLSLPVGAVAVGNTPPIANKDVRLSMFGDSTLPIKASDVATDADGDPLYFSKIFTQPAHGNAIGLDGAIPSILYTPDPNYTGIDKFEYEVTDTPNNPTSSAARGTITVYVDVPIPITPQAALNINVQGGTTQLAKLNSSAALSIAVTDDSNQPVVGANVAWSVTPSCAATLQPTIAAQVCTDFSPQPDPTTDGLGLAHAKLSIPNTLGTYDVSITVTTVPGQLQKTINFSVVASDLPGLTRPGTPEAAMADVLDVMCRALQTSTTPLTVLQTELLARCVDIMNASGSDAVTALRSLAPDEAAAQGRMGNNFAQQQMGNIGARLAALRSGATGLGLSGLSFNIKGRFVPGSVFAQALEADARNATPVDLPQVAPKWSGFISGTVGGGDKTHTASEEGFNFHTRGLTAGADYRYSSATVLGSALGYARSDVDLDANGGGLNASGISLSLYGTYYSTQNFYLDAVLNYGANDYKQTRNITYFQKTARSDTQAKLLALSVGGGYEFTARSGASAEVSLRLHRIASTIDGYTETGANELNLTLRDQYIQVFSSSLGTRGSWPLSLKWGVLIPQMDVSWEHELNDGAHQIKGNFVNDQFATTFAFKTDDPDRNYFQLGLGASAVIPGGKTAFLQYQTTLGREHYRDYNVALGARVELR